MPFGWIDADNPIPGQIDAAATRYGVPRELAHVVAQMESDYNPQADSGKAQGVMQLTPATGTALGVGNRFDSAQNIDAGVRLLGSLLRKYGGDTRLTLAAYNAGEGNVDRAGRNVPNFPETQAYVQKGMSLLYPGMKTDAKAAPTGDEFGWIEAPTTPAALPAFKAPEGTALGRVGSNVWDTTVGGIRKMLTTNPYDMFRDAAVQHIMQAAEAVDAYKRGDWSALGHVAGAAIPFIGPGLVTAAEVMGGEAPVFDKYGNVVRQGREPDIASGTGQMIGLAGPAFVGDVAKAGGKVVDAVVPAATEAAARTGAAAIDVAGGVNPAVRDAIGVISPRAKNILNTAARIKQAKDAFVAAKEAAAASEAAAPEAAAPPAPVSPGEAFAKSQGIDWASLKPEEQAILEHTARAQANAAAAPPPKPAYTPPPEPPVTAPVAPSKTVAEMIQEEIAAKKAAQAPPEEPPAAPPVAPAAAAVSVPETPPPEAPVSAVAARPAAAQAAADLEAAMRPDRLTDYLVANKIPGAMIEQFGPAEWQMVADQARTLPPTADDIAAVRAKIGEYEGAASMPAEAAKASPAEAVAEFEQRKATRTRRKAAAAAPAAEAPAAAPPAAVPPTFPPGINPAQQLAEMMPEHAVEPPAAGPRAPTASETRIETLAKALAAGDIPTSELERLPHITDAELLLEDLARAHGEARPAAAELPQIVDRVRELRGEPKALAKGEGEAAYQEQQARIEPPTVGAAAEAPKSISETLQDTADAAMKRIRQRGTFSGTKLNAAVPVDDLADMAIWGAAKIAKGTVDFAKWSKEMIADAGQQIKPHLENLWAQSQKIYERHVANTNGKLASTKELLRLYKVGEVGKDWYKNTQKELETHFGGDAPLFVDMLAATSPNSTVASNVTLALKAYTQWKTGQPFQGFMPAVIGNLEKVVRGEPVGGPKVSSFKANLFGDPLPVTVDRWMARAMGKPTDSLTPAQYKFYDYTLTQVANKVGVEPRQLQAGIWKAIKEAEGKAGNTSESFEQVLARNVAAQPALRELLQQLRAGR